METRQTSEAGLKREAIRPVADAVAVFDHRE